MNRRKRALQVIALGIGTMMLCTAAYIAQPEVVQIEEETCALGDSAGVLIKQTDADINVIPDRYNTGAQGELTKVDIGTVVNDIQFVSASENTRNVLDFGYRNKTVSGTVVFKNYDFSNYELWSYNENKVDRSIKLIFENCKFSKIAVGKDKSNLSFEFNNCSIECFNGSNAVFNHCQFGKSCIDGIVPFQNVEVNDCFFLDMACEKGSEKAVHTDGTQIYGVAGIDVQNLSYKNCRFEIPPLTVAGSAASVNACIMLQLEYSNAKNVTFSDCIVNGGGYSLYAWDKNKGYTFENVVFDGIQAGCAKKYGIVYGTINPMIELKNISATDALYVASVWKDGGKTHFSVSNDTSQERTLVIVTNKGKYEYTIPACPNGKQLTSSSTYSDFPFDIDIIVPENCEYAVCFDNTYEGCAEQIRFANWSGKSVYLDKAVSDALTGSSQEVLLSGKCGDNVTFSLTKDGVLVLSGEGGTEGYHSTKLPPWTEYVDHIREIKIEEGIDKLSGQIFKDCVAVKDVVLPNGLKTIEKRAFSGCSSLISIMMPESLESIGDSAFKGTCLREIRYKGDDWGTVTLGKDNDALTSKVIYVEDADDNQKEGPAIVMQGYCGENAEYILTENGVLRIIGKGSTYNYHSAKTAPWYDSRAMIKEVIVEAGIEEIGSQLFRKCSEIEKVELPEGLKVIGSNCFISCPKLQQIVVPRSVNEIGRYAFSGDYKLKPVYSGTPADWSQIIIGIRNEILCEKICFL